MSDALAALLPHEMTELRLRPLFIFELAVKAASVIGKTPGVDRRRHDPVRRQRLAGGAQ
jgi:hypothetical protein